MANRLDLADAQLIGFFHGKWHGHDIISLIQAMGLTNKEWIKLKNDYPMTHIEQSEMIEIDNYFAKI